jgi:hypothetical protein
MGNGQWHLRLAGAVGIGCLTVIFILGCGLGFTIVALSADEHRKRVKLICGSLAHVE